MVEAGSVHFCCPNQICINVYVITSKHWDACFIDSNNVMEENFCCFWVLKGLQGFWPCKVRFNESVFVGYTGIALQWLLLQDRARIQICFKKNLDSLQVWDFSTIAPAFFIVMIFTCPWSVQRHHPGTSDIIGPKSLAKRIQMNRLARCHYLIWTSDVCLFSHH